MHQLWKRFGIHRLIDFALLKAADFDSLAELSLIERRRIQSFHSWYMSYQPKSVLGFTGREFESWIVAKSEVAAPQQVLNDVKAVPIAVPEQTTATNKNSKGIGQEESTTNYHLFGNGLENSAAKYIDHRVGYDNARLLMLGLVFGCFIILFIVMASLASSEKEAMQNDYDNEARNSFYNNGGSFGSNGVSAGYRYSSNDDFW